MSSAPVSRPALLPQDLFQSRIANENGLVVERVWRDFFSRISTPARQVTFLQGTHASRANILASSYTTGSLFQESDRAVFYIAIRGAWTYFTGVMQTTQDSLPTDLGVADTGFLVNVTDYAHVLQWDGAGWQWGPGDSQSGFIVAFVNPPPDVGWQECDGSAGIGQLLSNGGLDFTVTVPNTPGSFFRQ